MFKEIDQMGEDVLLETLLTNLSSKKLLQILLKNLQKDQNFKLQNLIELYQKQKGEVSIPLSIFSINLKPAEALSKYLKENENWSYKEIANKLNRDERTIWSSYNRSKKKRKQRFILKKENYKLPLSIFSDRNFSLLESVVLYLNSIYKLSTKEMAKILNKSQSNVAVLLKRAREK